MVSPESNIYLYGSGVFTTLRVVDGEPFLWEKHWRRLISTAERIGLATGGLDEVSLRRRVVDQARAAGLSNAKTRITVADVSKSQLWGGDGAPSVEISLLTSPLRTVAEGFSVGLSPVRVNSTSPLAGLKTCNYLEPLLAYRDAVCEGHDEAIRLNEHGQVVSACMANVFWLRSGELFTPALSTGCLPGTVRELIIDDLVCREVEASVEELLEAEAVFLTSSGLGVVEVAELGGSAYKPSRHPALGLVPRP